MPETDAQRAETADKLAYARGKREAEVDARLNAHDERFRLINGSIEKHAKNAGQLRDVVESQGDKLEQIIATLATNAALEQEKAKQLKIANDKSLSSRTYIFGVIGIMVAMMGVCATLLEVVH